MKRISTLVLTVFILSGLAVSLLACGQDLDSTAVAEEQLVTVQRGDLTIDITAVGNLAFSHQEELTFGVSGTVGEVLVEVGDSVEEGQVLAKLDDTSIISLQKAVVQAEINLEKAQNPYTESDIIQAKLSVINAEMALKTAEENLEEAQNPYTELDVAQAEATVVNAKVALEAAQEALEKAENPYTESDIVQAELAVINAEIALDKAEDDLERAEERYNRNWTVPEWILDYKQKKMELAIAEFELAEAEETLVEMMAGADPLEVEQKQKQQAIAESDLAKAEETLVEMMAGADPLEVEQKQKQQAIAEINLASAEQSLAEMLGSVYSLEVELRQLEVATAQATLDEAVERLEMATMAAPFAGIVTSVNAESGEAVNANQVVIELVDTDKFEAEILVSETDIFNIRLGAQATVQVDSVSGISFPANVTFIAPTATIQQGVVNYNVKVEIQSLQAMMLERQEAMPDISSGELPDRIKQAIEEGFITQEQAEEMLEQMQEGKMPFQQGGEQGDISLLQGGGQLPTITSEDLQLREGLTVTISIIVAESNDVLLVPNSAITTSGRQTYVQVLSPDGTSEDRLVTTGISDWQYTEVIEGLSEGEQVVVPETTTTTSTTQQDQPSRIIFPGMGR